MSLKRSSSKMDKENEVQGSDCKKICNQTDDRTKRKRTALKPLVDENGDSIPLKRQRRQAILTATISTESFKTAKSGSEDIDAEWSDWDDNEEYYDFEQCGDFQTIPDHVMSRIFSYLSREEKLEATTVCKRFERIFCEPTNMKDFRLSLNFDTNEMPVLKRRYQVIDITNLALPASPVRASAIKGVFKSMGEHFKKIEFFRCTLTERFVLTALGFCPNIKKLAFTGCKIIKSKGLLVYPRLQQLKIFRTDISSMSVAAALLRRVETLEEFSIKKGVENILDIATVLSWHDKIEIYDVIKEMIARQDNLKSMEISDGDFFEKEFAKTSFQLDTLVFYQPIMERSQPINMLKFLRKQKKVSKLILNTRLNYLSQSFNSCMRYIMDMSTLRELKIVFYSQMGMNTMFLDSKIVNPNLVDLYISLRPFPHEYRRIIEKIGTIFPNVKSLHIKIDQEWMNPLNTTEKTFKPLSSLKKLESLTIEGAATRLITMIKLPNLKRCILSELHTLNSTDWELFFKNNRHVEHMTVLFSDENQNINGPSLLYVSEFFEHAILQLQNARAIKACVNGMRIANEEIRYLEEYAVNNKGLHLEHLQICDNRLNI